MGRRQLVAEGARRTAGVADGAVDDEHDRKDQAHVQVLLDLHAPPARLSRAVVLYAPGPLGCHVEYQRVHGPHDQDQGEGHQRMEPEILASGGWPGQGHPSPRRPAS